MFTSWSSLSLVFFVFASFVIVSSCVIPVGSCESLVLFLVVMSFVSSVFWMSVFFDCVSFGEFVLCSMLWCWD